MESKSNFPFLRMVGQATPRRRNSDFKFTLKTKKNDGRENRCISKYHMPLTYTSYLILCIYKRSHAHNTEIHVRVYLKNAHILILKKCCVCEKKWRHMRLLLQEIWNTNRNRWNKSAPTRCCWRELERVASGLRGQWENEETLKAFWKPNFTKNREWFEHFDLCFAPLARFLASWYTRTQYQYLKYTFQVTIFTVRIIEIIWGAWISPKLHLI